MLTYHELYEIVRKEKYSEQLQLLPANFLADIGGYLNDKKEQSMQEDSLFAESSAKSKKQLENSLVLFKELISKRKDKLLKLVYIAAETGIMKRDYENMLSFEKEMFEKFVRAMEEGDKDLSKMIRDRGEEENYKLIMFNQDVEQFVDMSGKILGPFKSGEFAHLDKKVSEILVSGGKADFVDS